MPLAQPRGAQRAGRRGAAGAGRAAKLPEELRDLTLPNAHFELVLELAEPNEDVEVEAPEDAQPFPSL